MLRGDRFPKPGCGSHDAPLGEIRSGNRPVSAVRGEITSGKHVAADRRERSDDERSARWRRAESLQKFSASHIGDWLPATGIAPVDDGWSRPRPDQVSEVEVSVAQSIALREGVEDLERAGPKIVGQRRRGFDAGTKIAVEQGQ